MQAFRISAASTSARWGRIDYNLDLIKNAAENAADNNARILLLPECCITGADWPDGSQFPALEETAISLESPIITAVGDIAAETGVMLIPGLYENLNGAIHISQIVIDGSGIRGVYRKVHEGRLSSRDKNLFPVIETEWGRIGISICYDNMFPECARILALKGAEVLMAPFTSLPLHRKTWRLMRLVALRARAQDNRMFVVSASHAMPHIKGKPAEWGYSGICCAVNPLGEVIAESRGRVGTPQNICATLDEKLQRTYLIADVPALKNRRAGDYGELIDTELQKQYLSMAPPFVYNETSDRGIANKE